MTGGSRQAPTGFKFPRAWDSPQALASTCVPPSLLLSASSHPSPFSCSTLSSLSFFYLFFQSIHLFLIYYFPPFSLSSFFLSSSFHDSSLIRVFFFFSFSYSILLYLLFSTFSSFSFPLFISSLPFPSLSFMFFLQILSPLLSVFFFIIFSSLPLSIIFLSLSFLSFPIPIFPGPVSRVITAPSRPLLGGLYLISPLFSVHVPVSHFRVVGRSSFSPTYKYISLIILTRVLYFTNDQ